MSVFDLVFVFVIADGVNLKWANGVFFMPEMFWLFKTTFSKKIKTNGDIQGSKEKYLESIIRLLEPTFKFSFISSFLGFVEAPVGQRILLWFLPVLCVERGSYIGLRLYLSLNHQERVYAYDDT